MLGFLAIFRNSGKTGPTWRAVGEICDPRVRGRLRMIFRESRDPPPNLGICFGPTDRWLCDIYMDFSGHGPTWCGGIRDSPEPRPNAQRLQEIARFPGESQKLHHSPRAVDFPGFLGSVGIRRKRGKYATPRNRGRLRRVFRIPRDSAMDLRNRCAGTLPPSPRGGICDIYADFSGPVGIMRKRALSGAGGRNTWPSDSWPSA